MTVATNPVFAPARTLPNGDHFWSPVGLYEFQTRHVAEAYARLESGAEQGLFVLWDCGLGKSFFAMALASLLYKHGEVDLVILVAEKNKILDWERDFTAHTVLAVHRYHGQGRQKRLAKADDRHVLVSSYETLRADLTSYEKRPGKRSRGKAVDGPLFTALGLRGKRVLWIFDEIPKLRNRSAQVHKAFAFTLKELRKTTRQHVVGLTGTPLERDYEDAYNLGRIVIPDRMPLVGEFERRWTRGRDMYQRYIWRRPQVDQEFPALLQPSCLIKHKSDLDVIAQFPERVEKALHVPLEPAHRQLYDAVQDLLTPEQTMSEQETRSLQESALTLLRMTAGHPAAHLYAQNPTSQKIVEILGVEGLHAIPSSKSVELIARLRPIVQGQGAQAVVFTFFGQSVLRALAVDLREAGFTLAEYHGGLSMRQQAQAVEAFAGGEVQILLASDAAAKGLNLPSASYVIEYESALTFAQRTQRLDRAHRLGSGKAGVTCYTLIAEQTVEVSLAQAMLRRNEDHDRLVLDDTPSDSYISAGERRLLLDMPQRGLRSGGAIR